MPSKNAASRTATLPRTLAVDIGGSGIKVMVLDAEGRPVTERARVATPRPATPAAVLAAIVALAKRQGGFERVSVGFPGVVRHGVTQTAPNLHPSWAGVRLAETLAGRLGKPVRAANDGDVQGYGAIEGRDVEMVITLGTGLGSALFVDGRLVPNLEVAHHPFERGKTYEQRLGNAALTKAGPKKWSQRLLRALDQLEQLFNYDRLFIGGGNAEKITTTLPPNTKIVSNRAGLLGGIALWREEANTAAPRIRSL